MSETGPAAGSRVVRPVPCATPEHLAHGTGASGACDVGSGPLGGRMTEEAEQGGIDLIGVDPGDGVRAAFDDEVDVGDQPGQPLTGFVERQHPGPRRPG